MAKKSVNDPESLGWTDDGNGFWSWSGDGSGGGDSYWSEADVGIEYDGTVNAYTLRAVNIFSRSGTNSNKSCGFASGVISATGAISDDIIFYGSDISRFTTSNISAGGDAWFQGGLTTDGTVTASDYLDANGNSIVGGTGGGSSLWEQNGDDIYYNDGSVGVGTSDISALSGKPTIHVNDDNGNGAVRIGNQSNSGGNVFLDHSDAEGARLRSNSCDMNIGAGAGQEIKLFTGNAGETRVTIDEFGKVGVGTDDPTHPLSISAPYVASTSNSTAVALRSRQNGNWYNNGIWSNGLNLQISTGTTGTNGPSLSDVAVTISATGNVGIGVDPTTGTFDLTAKEQLKEWKTKAKKASWPIVTDGAFEQEPTEDLVEQWIETRAANDKLQVKGNISATGSVSAGYNVRITTDNTTNARLRYSGLTNGTYFAIRDDDAGVDRLKIDHTGDATFSGSVTATSIGSAQTSISFGVGQNRIYPNKDGSISDGTVDIGQGGGTPYRFKDGFFSGTVTAGNLKIGSNSLWRNSQAGILFGTSSGTNRVIYPTDGTGALDPTVTLSLGTATNKFASAHFSGSVNAEAANFSGEVTATRIRASNDLVLNKAADNRIFYTDDLKIYRNGVGATLTFDQSGDATFSGSVNAGGLLSSQPDAGAQAFAAGTNAGATSQGASSVALGSGAGQTSQGDNAVAVGRKAGQNAQSTNSVAIGNDAGATSQGQNSVAIGRGAGYLNQGNGGILISSMGSPYTRNEKNHIMLASSSGSLLYNGSSAWTFEGGTVNGTRMIQDGSPVIDAKGLITTLSTLRNATKDETTLEGLRDSIGNAIGGLIEKFEAEIAAMPAPETGTMETLQ